MDVEDTEETSTAVVIRSNIIESKTFGDKKLEKTISEIVDEVIRCDIRLSDTPETREALRDYVRIEIILTKEFANAFHHPKDITTAKERMIRSCVKMKMDIRDEVYKDVKGKPGKEIEMGLVREQVAKRVIKAQKDVDILD